MSDSETLQPVYGYSDVIGINAQVHPQEAMTFENLQAAESQFRIEARQHFQINDRELILRLFKGEPDGDEDKYGYDDEPDFILIAQLGYGNDFEIVREL
jgi:hypothetical protein